MDIMGNEWPIQSQLAPSEASSDDDPRAALKLINHSTCVILSKAKSQLDTLSVSRYVPNAGFMLDKSKSSLITDLYVFISLCRCPLSGWLWNASTTGSSPIRATCGVTVGGTVSLHPLPSLLLLSHPFPRSDHLGADDLRRQTVRWHPDAGNPGHPGERGAVAAASDLHHRCLHGHGQM